jgi:hypothetical protein
MTNTNKAGIVILVVVIALFVVAIARGLTRGDTWNEQADDATIQGFLAAAPAGVQWLRGYGASRVPHIVAADILDWPAKAASLANGTSLKVQILKSADGSEYRFGVFRLVDVASTVGRLRIHYSSSCLPPSIDPGSAAGQELREQEVTLSYPAPPMDNESRCTDRDHACGRVTVFTCGGTLTMTCSALPGCEAALQ